MKTRLLTVQDIDQFKNLLDRSYIAKEPKEIDTDERYISLLRYSDETSPIRLYGSFDEEDNLLSSCAIHLWDKLPFYTLIFIMTHPKFSNKRFSKSFEESGLKEAINMAILYAESKNYWQFFYATHVRNYKTRKDVWFQNNDMLASRYFWSVEDVVPAKQLPTSPVYASILFNMPRGVDTVIKTARLKPHLVFNKFHEQGSIPFSYEELYPNV